MEFEANENGFYFLIGFLQKGFSLLFFASQKLGSGFSAIIRVICGRLIENVISTTPPLLNRLTSGLSVFPTSGLPDFLRTTDSGLLL